MSSQSVGSRGQGHACGSERSLEQCGATSRPLAGCRVCVLSLCSSVPPLFFGEEGKISIERNLGLALLPTMNP